MVFLLLLAAIQGVTEFLPISSSGHLVLARSLVANGEPFAMDGSVEVLLHLGTLVSLLVFFRRRLIDFCTGLFCEHPGSSEARHLAGVLFFGTLPIVVFTLLFGDKADYLFRSPMLASSGLLLTAGVLFVSQYSPSEQKSVGDIGMLSALGIGIAQACAIFPGVSRSGMVIVVGLFLGLSPIASFELAFLLAIPALTGAGIWHFLVKDDPHLPSGAEWLAGAGVSMLFGLLALWALVQIVRAGKLHYFAPWCAALGLFGLFASRLT